MPSKLWNKPWQLANSDVVMSIFPLIVAASLGVVVTLWCRLEPPASEPEMVIAKDKINSEDPCGILWQEWKPGLVEEARANGRMVWLTFTADWSLLVRVNELRLFSNDDVVAHLAKNRVILIKADMTDNNQRMRDELQSYGRQTVPTNLIFPADPKREVIVLPELLTPEVAITGLDRAAGK